MSFSQAAGKTNKKRNKHHTANRGRHTPTALSCSNYPVVGPTLAWDYTDSGPLHVQQFKANNEVGFNWQRSVVCIQPPAPPQSISFFLIVTSRCSILRLNSSMSCTALIHPCFLQGVRHPPSHPCHSTAVKSWCVPYLSRPVFLQTLPLGIYPLSFPLHWHINTPALFRWKKAPQSPEPQSQNLRVKCLSRSGTETLWRRRAVGLLQVKSWRKMTFTAHKPLFDVYWSKNESFQDQKAMYNSPCM